MDLNLTNVLAKTLDTSTTNGNNVLDPIFLSKIISEQVRTIPSLRNAITRINWPTNVYTWDIISSFGNASTAADGGTLTAVDAAFSQSNSTMSYYYFIANITNPAILAAQQLVDIVGTRVGHAAAQVMRKEANAIYNGDSNNASNPGLIAGINAGPNASAFGAASTADRALFSTMDVTLRGNGYEPGCFVVSPNLYNLLSRAAFNSVRFFGIADAAQVGFPLSQGNLAINGVPVIMDFYAQKFVAVTGSTAMVGSAKNYKFSADGVAALSNQMAVQHAAGGDYAGVTWAAPLVKIAGVTKALGTDYSYAADGSLNFVSTPGSAPTCDFTYAQDNAFCLSLNPKDLVIAELLPIQADNDLGKPQTTDTVPIRVKQYATLAVRDAKAHMMAQNVVLPSVSAFLD